MKERELRHIIHKRINFNEIDENTPTYDVSFDMSGYNNSFYSNLELIAKFNDLLNINCDSENRQDVSHFPIFWKGTGHIIKINKMGEKEIIEELAGETTPEILFKIITLQNPKILD